jgi:protein-disulfide isomerase
MNKNLPIVIIGIVAIVAIVGGVLLFQSSKAENNKPKATANNAAPAIDKYKTAPPGAQPPWAKGSANATVTIEEFADFQCPSCAQFDPTIREIKTIYGDRVRIIFRQYPLQMHPKAYDAARAAEAAGVQGKFWEMHDLLYDKQKDWSVMENHRLTFADYAKSLGLDVEKFNNDLVGQVASSRVGLDKQRGDAINIRATPSVFINGRLLMPDEMQTLKLRQLIDNALQRK